MGQNMIEYTILLLSVGILLLIWLCYRLYSRLRGECNKVLIAVFGPPTAPEASGDELRKSLIFIATRLLFLMTGCWIVGGCIPILITSSLETSGTIGDGFGMINAWFSALAFGGVVVAILMQTLELRAQRFEMENSRQQLASSAASHLEAQQQLTKQTELVFFSTYLSAVQAATELSARDDSDLTTELRAMLFAVLARLERDQLQASMFGGDHGADRERQWRRKFSRVVDEIDRCASNNGTLVEIRDVSHFVSCARDQIETLFRSLPAKSSITPDPKLSLEAGWRELCDASMKLSAMEESPEGPDLSAKIGSILADISQCGWKLKQVRIQVEASDGQLGFS